MIDDLIRDARAYCDARGIKLATLGAYAVGDKTLFGRLESGGECLPRTARRVREYMADNPLPVSISTPEATPDTPEPEADAA